MLPLSPGSLIGSAGLRDKPPEDDPKARGGAAHSMSQGQGALLGRYLQTRAGSVLWGGRFGTSKEHSG